MTTITRQRSNYLVNPRGAAPSAQLAERRRNLFPNPRSVSTGTQPTAYGVGTLGTVTRAWWTFAPANLWPAGMTTTRQIDATTMGSSVNDRVGDYYDVAATPGQVYTAKAHARRIAGALGRHFRIVLEFRSASAALASVQAEDTLMHLSDGSDPVIRVAATTAAAPAGTTTLRVYLYAVGTEAVANTIAAVTFHYSAVLLELGTGNGTPSWSSADYFDGDVVDTAEDVYSWAGTAHASPSILLSSRVDVVTAPYTVTRLAQPAGWSSLAGDTAAVRDSFYKWKDGTTDAVRVQPAAGGTTAGPLLGPENDASKAATFPATLVVEARREVAGQAVTLAPVVNGTALTPQAVGDAYAVYRFPCTLIGGGGQDPRNAIRLGKTGTGALLIRATALVDEANYAGPIFDGSTATVGVLASVWTDPDTAPVSGSYQGIPSLSLVATAEPAGSNYPPRVRIDVADVDTFDPARELAVLRVDSSGRRTPVRAARGDVAELAIAGTGSAVTLYDYEAPLGVASSYTVGESIPVIPSARVTPNDTRAWLIHPGVPARSRPLSIASLGKRVRRVAKGVFDVIGRGDPITRTDGKRKTPTSELVVRTYTDAEREALDLLLDDAATLLLSIPPDKRWGVTYEWVTIDDTDEDRTANLGSWPRRLWTLPYRVVGRPIGGTRSARTWHDVAGEAVSWREVARQRDSWDEVADPTEPAA